MTDDDRYAAWLLAEHAALAGETAVVSLGPASQDPSLAALLMAAADLRRTADQLFQDIAQRVGAGIPALRHLH